MGEFFTVVSVGVGSITAVALSAAVAAFINKQPFSSWSNPDLFKPPNPFKPHGMWPGQGDLLGPQPEISIKLTLLPSPSELDWEKSPDYQAELQRLRKSLYFGHPQSTTPGEFTIKLAAILGPLLGTIVGAWLQARYGRKVRLKIGDIEAEASTKEEVETLLARAQEIQRARGIGAQPEIGTQPYRRPHQRRRERREKGKA